MCNAPGNFTILDFAATMLFNSTAIICRPHGLSVGSKHINMLAPRAESYSGSQSTSSYTKANVDCLLCQARKIAAGSTYSDSMHVRGTESKVVPNSHLQFLLYCVRLNAMQCLSCASTALTFTAC